jgi:hypothetical protein
VGREITGIILSPQRALEIYQTENLQKPGYSMAAAVLRASIKGTDRGSLYSKVHKKSQTLQTIS